MLLREMEDLPIRSRNDFKVGRNLIWLAVC